MKRRWIQVVALAGLASFGLAQVAQAQTDAAPEGPVVLRVGTTVDLDHDNVWAVSAGNDWVVATTQYDMLLKFDSADLSAAPSLAEGCEPDATFMEWTCTLREGLLWSDGEPLTSADVAFSYEFVIDHKIPQYKSYFAFDPVFTTPDARTLVWTADQPTFAPDMPPWVYIVPEHVWASHVGEDLKTIKGVSSTPGVGSGPFTLSDWDQGRSWTMTRNPNYWGPEPVVDEIQYKLYTNPEALVQALKNGEVDIVDGVNPSLGDTLAADPAISLQTTVADWWLNLAFNFGGQGPEADPLPALHDIRVRKAIAMAIDKQEIVDKVYLGIASPGDTIVRPASAFWHLDVPADQELPYDPAGSNALLDDAGYLDTDDDGVREDPATGEPLQIDMPASEPTAGAVEAGQLIVGYLREIGVEVNLLPVSDAKMGDYWGAGSFDAYIWYWSGDPDPNYQLFVFSSEQCGAWSDGCWQDPVFDGYYEEQRGIMDRVARQEVVFAAQQRVYDEVPVVVLAYPSTLQAYRNDRFTGWVPHPGDDGYLLPSYNYDSLVAITPVSASAGGTVGAASAGLPAWVWVAGVGVIGAVVAVVMMRGKRRRVDEEG